MIKNNNHNKNKLGIYDFREKQRNSIYDRRSIVLRIFTSNFLTIEPIIY
ncbi:hypothetical protein CNEO4_520020 [Clostridium neonatale]|nr:hypothetical protein CNEO4_520020 [Clostridium neonatale]